MTTEHYLVEYYDPSSLYDHFSGHIQFTETAGLYERGDVNTRKSTNGRSEFYSVERDQPLNGVTLLHQRSLVHGPDPTIHVLLCVRTEEICPHPAVFCLRANHRVLIVNVGAHSCMARLSKRERERDWGERERERETGWICELLAEDRKNVSGRLMSGKLCFHVYWNWQPSPQWGQSLQQYCKKKKNGGEGEQSAAAETMWTLTKKKKTFHRLYFPTAFQEKLVQKYIKSL